MTLYQVHNKTKNRPEKGAWQRSDAVAAKALFEKMYPKNVFKLRPWKSKND